MDKQLTEEGLETKLQDNATHVFQQFIVTGGLPVRMVLQISKL
jgi:hypothetical protein